MKLDSVDNAKAFIAASGGKFSGCIFFANEIAEPVALDDGNVVFPRGWSDAQVAEYRAKASSGQPR